MSNTEDQEQPNTSDVLNTALLQLIYEAGGKILLDTTAAPGGKWRINWALASNGLLTLTHEEVK